MLEKCLAISSSRLAILGAAKSEKRGPLGSGHRKQRSNKIGPSKKGCQGIAVTFEIDGNDYFLSQGRDLFKRGSSAKPGEASL